VALADLRLELVPLPPPVRQTDNKRVSRSVRCQDTTEEKSTTDEQKVWEGRFGFGRV
jgi:hypothetical protein